MGKIVGLNGTLGIVKAEILVLYDVLLDDPENRLDLKGTN